MKHIKRSLFILSICMGACTSEEVWNNYSQKIEEGEITKIEAVVSAFDIEDRGSRTTITMGSSTIDNPVWAEGDTIGIYPTTGDQLSFPIVEGVGTSTCEFNGGGWALKTSTSYTAYSPFNRTYYYKDNDKLPVSMLGQKQVGNDNSDHLGAYDIQIAKGTTPSTGKISFAFEHQVAIVRMDLTTPVAAEWTSLTLESDALFTTEAKMNLTTSTPSLSPVTTSNSVRLELENVITTEDNKVVTAYMMMLPVNLTNKKLSIKLVDSEGNLYVSSASITNTNHNFTASSARWITANAFTTREKPSYEWYTNTSSNTYTINSSKDFIGFAKLVNGDADALVAVNTTAAVNFQNKTINITSDIDLSGYCNATFGSWMPINDFRGTLNGNGYDIRNLYINAKNMDAGLFASINGATINKLNVGYMTGATIKVGELYQNNIGVLAAKCISSKIVNCNVNADIELVSQIGSNNVGGMCGYVSDNSIIMASETYVTINMTKGINEVVGGIVGELRSSSLIACYRPSNIGLFSISGLSNSTSVGYIGGVVGFSVGANIVACYSNDEINSPSFGGFIGRCTDGSGTSDVTTITNCFYWASVAEKGVQSDYHSSHNGLVGLVDSDIATTEHAETLNEGIKSWNTANPSNQCLYKFYSAENGMPYVGLEEGAPL